MAGASDLVALAQEYGVHEREASPVAALDAIADELRSSRLRTELGKTQLASLCVEVLTDHATSTAALRVLANLCIDHEANRKHLLELGAVPAVLGALPAASASLTQADRQRALTALGALLNIQMDYAPAKKAMREAHVPPRVCTLATCPGLYVFGAWMRQSGDLETWVEHQTLGATAAEWGLRLVHDILEEDDEQVDQEWMPDAVKALLRPLQAVYAASDAVIPPETVATAADLAENELSMLESIAVLLERAAPSFASAVVTPDDEPLRTFVQIVTHPPRLPSDWKGLLEEEELQRTEAVLAQLPAGAAHVIVAAAAEDANLDKLCPLQGASIAPSWFVEALVVAVHSSEAPTASCAMLALGNLARDDGVVRHLAADNIRLAHAAVGLLKNLAIPVPNKAPIVAAGVVPLLLPLLSRERDMVQPLQHGVVGLLKHLANSVTVPLAALGLLGAWPSAESPLEALEALRMRTDQVSLRLEIARIYVSLIRTLWSARANDVPRLAADAQASEQELSGALEKARADLQTEPVFSALVDLLRFGRKYAVLVSDSLLALTLASSTSKAAAEIALRCVTVHVVVPTDVGQDAPFTSGVEALVYVLESMPPQVVGNACSLLQILSLAPTSDDRRVLAQAVQIPLEQCEARVQQDVGRVVARARDLLTPSAAASAPST